MTFELAQVNVARLAAPIDSVQLQPFVAALDHVNAEAEASPGFRWRLQSENWLRRWHLTPFGGQFRHHFVPAWVRNVGLLGHHPAA